MGKSYYKSPVGILEIVCENDTVTSLKLVEKAPKSNSENKSIETQLDEYFSGKRTGFDIKLKPKGTEFQKLVWSELQKIPFGKTKSYSEIAQIIGHPNTQRAVGSACNKNPIMIIIPCHRVISKSGNLGGFAYGNLIKQKLLNIEIKGVIS
jgi:methylated-DNA-[protein]-cysteine S-methyltransferase